MSKKSDIDKIVVYLRTHYTKSGNDIRFGIHTDEEERIEAVHCWIRQPWRYKNKGKHWFVSGGRNPHRSWDAAIRCVAEWIYDDWRQIADRICQKVLG